MDSVRIRCCALGTRNLRGATPHGFLHGRRSQTDLSPGYAAANEPPHGRALENQRVGKGQLATRRIRKRCLENTERRTRCSLTGARTESKSPKC